jgi:hypothetical protein
MAGVLIPLILPGITELLKVIAPLISGLVHQHAPAVEAQQGPNTGPVKFADLNVIVMAGLIKAHAAGEITGDLPSPDLVKVMVQTAVSSMKAMGMLNPTNAPVASVVVAPVSAPGVQTIALDPNVTITISRS